MKKLITIVVILLILAGVFMYFFNKNADYDFLSRLSTCTTYPYPNPINEFNSLIEEFKKFGNFNWETNSNWFIQTWSFIGNFFNLIWSILKAPILMIYDITLDLFYMAKALFVMLGIINY